MATNSSISLFTNSPNFVAGHFLSTDWTYKTQQNIDVKWTVSIRWLFCAMLRKPFPAPLKRSSEKRNLSSIILKQNAPTPTQETVECPRTLRCTWPHKTFWIKNGWSKSDKIMYVYYHYNLHLWIRACEWSTRWFKYDRDWFFCNHNCSSL